MDVIDEAAANGHDQSENSKGDEDENEIKTINNVIEEKPKNIKANRPPPLNILDRVKMNNTPETPRSTIKRFLNVTGPTELNFSKEQLQRVQDQLKQALIEFHHKLRLLKSYRYTIFSLLLFQT